MKHGIPFFACLILATAALAQNHDRVFADAMIQHHQDGIRMAQLAVDKALNHELRTMAQTMIDDQRREIEQLQSLRGSDPASTTREMRRMPGMMSEDDVRHDMIRLQVAKERQFDVVFAEIMAKHHEGGIEMAEHEVANGTNEALKQLAQQIADKQTKEREQLLAFLPPMTSASRQRLAKD